MGHWMIKFDLKDVYFSVPVSKQHQPLLSFLHKSVRYQFSCLPFWLGPAPRLFTKLLKPVVALLRRLCLRLIIYLDDIIVFNQTQEDILRDRDSTLWLLQHLGFVINWKKSVLHPARCMEYLGFVINSLEMKLFLPTEKMSQLLQDCKDLILEKSASVRTLSHIIGRLTSTLQAVLPAPLHYRHLQMLQAKGLLEGKGYNSVVPLNKECQNDFQWWIDQLSTWNGRLIISPAPDLIITTDASLKGWGAACQGVHTRRLWTGEESLLHINALELKAALFALRAFSNNRKKLNVHLRMDNRTAVAYLLKMGGTRSQVLVGIAQELWKYALRKEISLTAEYLPGDMNHEADWQSRHFRDLSNWKLNPKVFQTLDQLWGPLTIDLFADRMNSQLPNFVSWFPDPFAQATDAFQIPWSNVKGYCFPPFSLICRCLAKIRKDQGTMVLIAPTFHAQAWYPVLLEMSCRHSTSSTEGSFTLSQPTATPSDSAGPPTISGLDGYRQNLLTGGVSEDTANLLRSHSWRKGTAGAYNSAWKQWSSWCGQQKVDPFCSTLASIADYLTELFKKGRSYHTVNIHRSAISAFHKPIDGVKVGQHDLVCRVINACFNARPP